MTKRHTIFLVNLLQDVNIVRPLAYLARELGTSVGFLLSHKFLERDTSGAWQQEVHRIVADTHASLAVYENEFAAYLALQGKSGVLIAASESSLSAHAHTHNVFRAAPSGFLKITLQHGFECVGFLQNREHNIAHGRNVTFAADLIGGWCDGSVLTSIAPSERSKLYVTGPSALVPVSSARRPSPEGEHGGGIVCENLHSVRLNIGGDFKSSFMDTFFAFCARMEEKGEPVTLRPHPGGQYVVKNKVALPPNVRLNNRPMYDVNLGAYDFGVSAPSSVIIDMVLAGVPTAVWADHDGVMDASNYNGLTTISVLDDWLAFARDAALRPQMLRDRQSAFLQRIGMPTEPRDVRDRFARLLAGGAQRLGEVRSGRSGGKKILFVANGFIPTLQLSFLKPLAGCEAIDEIKVLTEEELRAEFGDQHAKEAAREAFLERVAAFDPGLIVFCRYSGPHGPAVVDWARANNITVVYHIDDDLLNVPKEIGARKFRAHNRPERLASVRHLLNHADLVYCSTEALLGAFRKQKFTSPMVSGKIYCAGEVLRPAQDRPVRKLGYMGFDHAHDLALVLPALVEVLRANPHVEFELFGSIPKPSELEEFGERVSVIPPEPIYENFLAKFAALDWDIGICPLATTRFNAVKANTKWVEYTSVGAAVVATGGMAYDDCCADGCGILANQHEDWVAALNALCGDSTLRYRQVARAQERLAREYSTPRLREQIRNVFARARELALEPAL